MQTRTYRWMVAALALWGFAGGASAAITSFSGITGTANSQFVLSTRGLIAGCTACVVADSPTPVEGTYDISATPNSGFVTTGFLPNPPSLTGSLPAGTYTEVFGGGLSINVSDPLNTVYGCSSWQGGVCLITSTNIPGTLIAGTCTTVSLIAQPGTNQAVFQCALSGANSTLLALPAAQPLYLIVAGTTASPVSTVTTCIPNTSSSALCGSQSVPITYFGPLALTSWNATVSTSPYTPGSFVTVPNVVTLSQTTATTQLFNTGLTQENVITVPSSTAAAGVVIGQTPAAGTTVPSGWPYDLIVSSGPPAVAVPSVVGSTQSQAIAALTAAGFQVNSVTAAPSAANVAGLVAASTPAAGTLAAAGSAVALTVNAGPPAPPVLVNFSGDGTSSFHYFLYAYNIPGVGGPQEAFINTAENNPSSPYALYGNAAGGFDSAGNPQVFELSYSDQTTAVSCGTSIGCNQALFGTGTLTIIAVNTCTAVGGVANVGLASCDWTQGALGAGALYAGSSIDTVNGTLNANSVNQATLSVAYTPTASFAVATGIKTTISGAAQGYFTVTGATLSVAPSGSLTPTPVQLCFLTFGCSTVAAAGPFPAGTPGPFYLPFDIDWRASVSPTPYAAPSNSVTVPSVVGATQAAAATTFAASGLVTGSVTTQSSATVPVGVVISQSPAAGASAADGSAVNLTVSSGPLVGDVNGDGVVNCLDLAIVRASFGKRLGQAGFDPRADVNGDGVVNILDLSTVARALPAGTVCQ